MKKLTRITILLAAVVSVSRVALAGPNDNDLILSINNNDGSPAGSTEFNVDLGTLASLIAAGQYVGNVNLSSLVSTFNTQYASAGASGLNIGVAGGQDKVSITGIGSDVFVTTIRIGNEGNSWIPGTETAPTYPQAPSNVAGIEEAGTIAGNFSDYGANVSTSGAGSFTSVIAQDPATPGTAANNFTHSLEQLGGVNPLQAMTGSTITLDLWSDTITGIQTTTGWVYEGDLTFTYDPTGATPATLVWDVTAAPEPASYGLLSAATLMIISFRSLKLPLGRRIVHGPKC